MATKTLFEKIEALPPEKKAEVEHFVDALSERPCTGASGPGLVERLRAQRDELFREHGLFSSLPHIREFRETGGR